jgi:antitoxin (DNA-binding transcriptional repressor) of toxin-antitoxin stability system
MKVLEKNQATGTLAEFADDIEKGPVIVTHKGKPIAALLPIDNADMETVSLSTNPKFIKLIEDSRARQRAEGGISSIEMRRRLGKAREKNGRPTTAASKRSAKRVDR